ncbi:SDR family oxidoreductase [Microbacterium pseudoresistens]|uniref:NAD(P)-dependent dehydrogenase (Short-subunit alcohol dehydrogenase family) n=1 Tax=Microbacterium pseudoresistens TaxID=640634 RepID=A0A7Y9EU53_9MICO|nr:SDR family oxidoreductase [Microbacterium pseudoresistens]NYD53973.1 NAD(P)-dependent dehydrogenase (short-subunit alcohol dehydrogenase family) [Microbacterium pseudoresistens]
MSTQEPERITLDRKAVVVTGAGRGLGRAYALALAKRGASVVVNDIDADAAAEVAKEIAALGPAVSVHTASVAEPAGAASLVQQCVGEFGSIDGLVNNAGVLWQGPSWEISDDWVDRMLSVNIAATIHCGHAAIREMLRQPQGGSIVNVTSGTHLGSSGLSVYGATKGAVASLTYGWALELWDGPIRVNAISPLAITPMKLPPYDGHARPEDIAEAVCYLVSDRSARLRGQIVRRSHDEVGVISHPRIGAMARGEWTVESIAAYFDGPGAGSFDAVGYGSAARTGE